jgi:hypothetical protein
VAAFEVECAGCGVSFTAKSPRAKWHDPACKKRAQRKPESVVDEAGDGGEQEPTANSTYGRDVLDAVRRDLDKAGRLDTVDGRVAMYLARQSINPDCKNPAAMFKQMREALATALEGSEPAAPAVPVPEDEVEKARKAREQKASEASIR